jgi:tRNA(Ile)-lysidine synthase
VLERVTATARAHELFHRGDLVLVGCSGGADSVCLLDTLVRLRRLLGIRVAVLHVDHRLREGSARDARYVRRLATRLGVPFHLRVAPSAPPRGASVEAWARELRRAAAAEVASDVGAASVALGHTRDDQAETVLLGLVLGWGPEGVSGMRPSADGFVRPLLDVAREETLAYCRALGIRPRVDPTNADRRFLRNAIRLDALPALERATGRDVRATIARTAELLRRDQEVLWAEAVSLADGLVEPTDDGCRIPADRLVALPVSISSRVVRRAFQSLGAAWTQSDIEAALDLAAGRPGRRRDLTGALLARRDRVYLSLSRSSPESRV